MGPANGADRAWAWGAVRYGFTPEEWGALTQAQRAFLRKADEERTVEFFTLLRDAVQNAIANANRKKGKKPHPLFKRRKKAKGKKGRKVPQRKLEGIEAALAGPLPGRK